MRDSIASAAFQKGLPADHPLFGEMIMKEDLTLADSFALAEKHALWDEARRADKAPEQPKKELVMAQRKEDSRQRRPSGGTGPSRDFLEVFNSDPSNPPRRKRLSRGSSHQSNQEEILPRWTTPNIARSIEGQVTPQKLLHLEELSGEACEGRQSRQVFGQASSAAQTEC